MEQQSKKPGMDPRVTLIILVLVFVVPVGTAIVLHSIGGGFKTSSTTNHGNLVTPVRPLPTFSATTIDGKRFSNEDMQGKWVMLYVEKSDCDKSCENNLYTIRQSRLGMGGEKDRVLRVMLLSDDATGKSLDMYRKEHQGMVVLKADEQTRSAFYKTLEFEKLPAESAQRIYFVDPLGNVMMHYKNNVSPRDVVKDLERLLKYSRIG